jgi:hypothetical protein
MAEPKGFIMKGKEDIGYHPNKSIYRLKQASSSGMSSLIRILGILGLIRRIWRTIAFMQNLGIGD